MMESQFNILRTLHDEHFATLALLEKLEKALSAQQMVPSHEDDHFNRLLGDIEAVLHDEISHHYAFEEGHLFPLFAEFGDFGIAQMLGDEHEIIRPLAADLSALAKIGRQEGFNDGNWADFRDKGLELIERETFHIQKEEMGFLPAVEEMIDEDQDRELTMAYIEIKNA